MKHIEYRLARITEKLKGKGVPMNPVVAEDVFSFLEQRYQLSFPEEMRAFYTKIGNGCSMIDGFPLKPIEEVKLDHGHIGREFPFTDSWVWETSPNDYDMQEVAHGNIELIDIGDAQSWRLIVSGAERGQMWNFTDVGIQPCCPRMDFLSWFESWLDGECDYFREFTG